MEGRDRGRVRRMDTKGAGERKGWKRGKEDTRMERG